MQQEAVEQPLALPASAIGFIGLSGDIIWTRGTWTRRRITIRCRSLPRKWNVWPSACESQPDWKEPTESQKAEAVRGFDEALERMRAQRQGLRDFTAKVERERAERGRTENPTPDRS
jgi:hypothetical protein